MCRNDAMPDYLTDLFFAAILPIYEHHQQLLTDIEQRLASWSVLPYPIGTWSWNMY